MLNIIIFGAPGAGKGTQGSLISKNYGLEHISTGEILRKEIATGTELGKLANQYISKGNLAPDHLMIDIIESVIKNNMDVKGFVFDGFPRTLTQGVALDNKLTKNGIEISKVLRLDVDEEELIERLLNRGKVSGRSDDNRQTIESRLQVYHQQTEPLIDYYRKQGKLADIKGNSDIEAISKLITTVIDEYLAQ